MIFFPPELYVNLKSEYRCQGSHQVLEKEKMQELEGKMERETGKEREIEKAMESQRRKIEEQMAREKANNTQNDKRKAKETA